MTVDWIVPARIVPSDPELLARRARALAAGEAEADRGGDAARLVLFRVHGLPCAVDATPVVRAIARLAGATAVPTAGGADRIVVFVEEQPLPVADLAGTVAGAARTARELSGGAALVLETPAGDVAVAVEGPLDLREEACAGAALELLQGGAAGLRLSGRLADGTSVVDAGWLVSFAEKAARE